MAMLVAHAVTSPMQLASNPMIDTSQKKDSEETLVRMATEQTVPDEVTSAQPNDTFDEKVYAVLRNKFLEKRIYKNEELPGGRILRKKSMPPFIDTDQPGFQALKQEIVNLEKLGQHEAIFRILVQLRDWQVYNRGTPACIRATGNDDDN